MFALRELQEEKMRLEKLLCRHQMELKTLKEQHDWAKSGESWSCLLLTVLHGVGAVVWTVAY